VWLVTLSIATPFTPLTVALMEVNPALCPAASDPLVAVPLEFTIATAVFEDAQVACEVRFCVVPSAK
jgi:hypothetical protein